MIRRPPRSTLSSSSAASDVYKRQVFSFITDKDKAWVALLNLTNDPIKEVRFIANYSAGRISIYKGTIAADNEGLKKELENAIGFFENVSKEATYFNPAR